MDNVKYYAGIGSRKTPYTLLFLSVLEDEGYFLRSGGASGADSAFEKGCSSDRKEIYLPSASFNSKIANGEDYLDCSSFPNWDEAIKMAKFYYPAPNKLSRFSLNLMARNCYQILGKNLKSNAVICWTPNGKEVGGTAQAYDVPVLNYGHLLFG